MVSTASRESVSPFQTAELARLGSVVPLSPPNGCGKRRASRGYSPTLRRRRQSIQSPSGTEDESAYSATESSAPSESDSVLRQRLLARKTKQGGGRCHRHPHDHDAAAPLSGATSAGRGADGHAPDAPRRRKRCRREISVGDPVAAAVATARADPEEPSVDPPAVLQPTPATTSAATSWEAVGG